MVPSTSVAAPLHGVEELAWRAFIETVDDLTKALGDDLAVHGITLGNYQVFVLLSEAPQRTMRMVDLAAALHLSPSGLTRRLDRLVRLGYVDRMPSASDRRVMFAVLSDAGHAKLVEAYPTHVESVRRRFLDQCSADDVDALARVFSAIQRALCST